MNEGGIFMFKMPKLSILLIGAIIVGFSGICSAFTLLTQEEALKEAFWKDATIEKETKELTGAVLEKVKSRLGGNLVYFQEGAEQQEVEAKTTYDFYFGVKDGSRKGVAIIDTEPGKWGPVEFITTMDIKGTVKSVKVMSYQEQRGQPIARNSFTDQYKGKTSNSPLTVGKDIIGVSGATISSRSATFAVKKALVIYEELYLK
jgi:Na+-translocating ferredoxin:NAD+ oxidoreductase RnfG subunit